MVVVEIVLFVYDIGNFFFGYYGEVVFNDLSLVCGGYEGNV